MITYFKSSLLVILLIAVFSITAYAAKLTVCHVPPGNPANFHDITISENALQAHLNHGDFVGSCLENCAALCDDGDACTQDYVSENGECVCLDQHPPVDCDDSNPCTADSCDSVDGCEYDLSTNNGTLCDDGDDATTGDVCIDGVCEGTPAPQYDCPCMDETQMPGFVNFVENVTPEMDCELCSTDISLLLITDTSSTPSPSVIVDTHPSMGWFCGYNTSPVEGTVKAITVYQYSDCRDLLLDAAAEVELVCDCTP